MDTVFDKNSAELACRVHKFTFDEDILLLDVNSGSVHLIDEVMSEIIDAFKSCGDLEQAAQSAYHDSALVESATAEIKELIADGVLFSPPLTVAKTLPPTWLKSVCLNVSHDCDLRCGYCFAGTGDFGGERLNMPWEVARSAVDMLLKESGPRPFCEMDFFGGEPLLNLDVVKQTVAYGRAAAAKAGKQIKFTLTTNANALTGEVIDWLNAEGLSVVLSHDGRPEVHDKMRRLAAGGGSYESVNEHIRAMIQSRPHGNYYLRGTYTANNLDFTEDVLHWLSEGYRELSLEPVVTMRRVGWALNKEHLPVLREEYRKLARLVNEHRQMGQAFNFFHFNIDLEKGPCLPKRLWGCGAGYEYVAVTPSGELYPCHQFVGQPEFLLGTVSGGIIRPDISQRFKEAHIESKPACRDCWARYYCSGGCHANAHAAHGDLHQPYELGCELQKMRLECAVWLYVRNILNNE